MFITQKDCLIATIAFAIILVTTIVIERLLKKGKLTVLTGRKLLHFIAIMNCAWVIQSTNFRLLLGYIFIAFAAILLAIINRKILFVQTTKSYGIALFPLSFGILLLLPFLSILQITFAVTVLGISDAAAGYIGEKYATNKIKFLYETKSWLGFTTFYLLTFFLAFALLPFSLHSLLIAVIIAIVPALVELFSYKGSDNFTVPIVTALWLYTIQHLEPHTILSLIVSICILIAAAYLAYKKKWLTVAGATAAVLTGVCIAVWGSFTDFLIPIIFFLTGSFLSKLNKDAKETEGRNAFQVFANGFIAVICLAAFFISQKPIFHYCFIASFAVSMADTVSSEIGKFFKGNTINIMGLKPIQIGISGGISWQGTAAGLLAASFISSIATVTFHLPFNLGISIAIVGFVGMLLDSVLGSSVQALYLLKGTTYSEFHTPDSKLIKGYYWCNNDAVNLIANAISVAFFALYLTVISYQNGQ